MPRSVERRISATINIVEKAPFSLQLPQGGLKVVAGASTTTIIPYTPGEPPIEDGELIRPDWDLYTDAARTQKLSEDDKANYQLTIVKLSGNRIEMRLGTEAISSPPSNLYPVFIFRQPD